MNKNRLHSIGYLPAIFVLFLLPFVSKAQTVPIWQSGLETVINQRITDHQFVDGVVGAVSKNNPPEVAVFGKAKAETIFEIGSITKAFTGIVFAQMVQENLVSPSDTVEQYVPVLKNTFAGQIKLSELASHTSGLSRIPKDVSINTNPYLNYSWQQLLNYLKTTTPDPELKVTVRPFPMSYSNTGFALLGQILAQVDHVDFSQLIAKRITKPLEMNDTVFILDKEQTSRFIDGYDTALKLTSHWDFDAFAPTGAIRSTLNDMLKFAKINLYSDSSPLGEAIKLSQTQNWGWDSALLGFPFPYKNGGTGGFRSAFMVYPKRDVGIIVLTNTAYEADSLVVPILKSAAH